MELFQCRFVDQRDQLAQSLSLCVQGLQSFLYLGRKMLRKSNFWNGKEMQPEMRALLV